MKNIELFSIAQDQYDLNNKQIAQAQSDADGINDAQQDTINTKNLNLMQKNQVNNEQEKAIVDKQKLFLTRARMLQISKDRNSYKLKIIYTLLAFILFIFMTSLGIYVFFNNKAGKNNSA